MTDIIPITGLFLLIAALVSLGLSLAAAEEDPKIIARAAIKNFNLLCAIVLAICVAVNIINLL